MICTLFHQQMKCLKNYSLENSLLYIQYDLVHIKIISLNLKEHLICMDGCGVGYKTSTGCVLPVCGDRGP